MPITAPQFPTSDGAWLDVRVSIEGGQSVTFPISPFHLATWSDEDLAAKLADLSGALREFTDPGLRVESMAMWSTSASTIVLSAEEYGDIPPVVPDPDPPAEDPEPEEEPPPWEEGDDPVETSPPGEGDPQERSR